MNFYQMYQQCLEKNQPAQALQHLQQHLRKNRRHAYGFFQAGVLLQKMEQWPQALGAFLEACRLDPEQSLFHWNLGVVYNWLQQPESAIQSFNTAYEKNRDPEILLYRARAFLLAGNYQAGWKDYEWRIRLPKYEIKHNWYPSERIWRGQPFPGQTLVVYADQGGMGDDLQFCRYLPYVKALGGTVVFATWPHLTPIMSTLYGVDQIIECSPAAYSSQTFHWAVPLMSLPHIFNTTLDSIPNQTPYLSVPPSYRAKWQSLLKPYTALPGIKKIGLVYASANSKRRTCPFPLWSSLFSLPNLQWFSLQKGDAAAALQECAANQDNLIDLTCHIDDFADTAALLDHLDLLISIDTSVPHLAGALGKPVWLLLPFVSEWRWLQRRSDSPWYPSFRLFRQPLPEQWQPVVDQVRRALSAI